jgi:hypothetical protein
VHAHWSVLAAGSSCLLFPCDAKKLEEKATGTAEAPSGRVWSGDAVEAHAAHPHAPHMLPLKEKQTRESTASFKVNLLAGSGN